MDFTKDLSQDAADPNAARAMNAVATAATPICRPSNAIIVILTAVEVENSRCKSTEIRGGGRGLDGRDGASCARDHSGRGRRSRTGLAWTAANADGALVDGCRGQRSCGRRSMTELSRTALEDGAVADDTRGRRS